jgi:NAD+ synthase (glutamine-hydrolysing)
MVVGTGDLSEIALGWSTYNGDHMSMYAVNCSVPKTLVRYLVAWAADNVVDGGTRDTLRRIIETPVTPELLPPDPDGGIGQETERIIGPYELHDFFLYWHARFGAPPEKILFLAERAFEGRYGREELRSWLGTFYRRFFAQQFKRSCMPDGPKVGSVSLSPRGDWRMPSDAEVDGWLARLSRADPDTP